MLLPRQSNKLLIALDRACVALLCGIEASLRGTTYAAGNVFRSASCYHQDSRLHLVQTKNLRATNLTKFLGLLAESPEIERKA